MTQIATTTMKNQVSGKINWFFPSKVNFSEVPRALTLITCKLTKNKIQKPQMNENAKASSFIQIIPLPEEIPKPTGLWKSQTGFLKGRIPDKIKFGYYRKRITMSKSKNVKKPIISKLKKIKVKKISYRHWNGHKFVEVYTSSRWGSKKRSKYQVCNARSEKYNIINKSITVIPSHLPRETPSMNKCRWKLGHSCFHIVVQNGRWEWKPPRPQNPHKAEKLKLKIKCSL